MSINKQKEGKILVNHKEILLKVNREAYAIPTSHPMNFDTVHTILKANKLN